MPIDYDELMQAKSTGLLASYGDRETILYALGVGFMRDPMDESELKFVYEESDAQTVPTMATVIGWGIGSGRLPRTRLNALMVLHGEQRLTLHKPLPFAADVVFDERVIGVFDKGRDKGALIVTERVIKERNSGDQLCTLQSTTFARADGGFGGPRHGAPEPHRLPARKADLIWACDTRPDQALLYALSGDRNPLHRDPEAARVAGFQQPILHGLCSYGTACRAVISGVCAYDATQIVGFDVRFSAPVIPGETIVTEMWVDGRTVSFRSKVKERDVVVLDNGKCTLAS